MAQGITFTNYIPTSLVGVNSTSPTLAAEVVTGLPIPTGAFPGNVFYLTEAQANQLSQTSVNSAPLMTCHAGWYMVAQVSSSAVAANIVQGAIGAQAAIPTTAAQEGANIALQSVVTDGATAATASMLGVNPVVFLNAVTPGNYTIVQINGDASVLLAASQTTVIGDALLSATPGSCTAGSTTALTCHNIQNLVGLAEQVVVTPAAALVLSAAAAASSGSTAYTGTITGGGSNAFAGLYFVVAGFTKATNNSAYAGAQGFLCTASTTGVLTLTNALGLAETHAGTATSTNLVRANVNFPFGSI
ncbi:MAG: hypothetical protein ACLQGT_05700 [Terracidiphilus sp.]